METKTTTAPEFFFFAGGWLSQWYKCDFTVDGQKYNCAEQWMMAEKSRLFKDEKTRQDILKEQSPRAQKILGRLAKPFNGKLWDLNKEQIVYEGNRAKFSQNPHLKKLLLETGDKHIVEASPWDTIWGIGLAANDPRAKDPTKWRGQNLLGKALMRVRNDLKQCS
jgi:ribA/ribD-fused uncharacterized protein